MRRDGDSSLFKEQSLMPGFVEDFGGQVLSKEEELGDAVGADFSGKQSNE